jgi:ribosomal protein S18 acetylase RimI-like enzyme
LWLDEPYRKQGFGRALVDYWEKAMLGQDFHQVMTSTQSNENAQHFYRKLGYKDCGALLMPDEALELLFLKELV